VLPSLSLTNFGRSLAILNALGVPSPVGASQPEEIMIWCATEQRHNVGRKYKRKQNEIIWTKIQWFAERPNSFFKLTTLKKRPIYYTRKQSRGIQQEKRIPRTYRRERADWDAWSIASYVPLSNIVNHHLSGVQPVEKAHQHGS